MYARERVRLRGKYRDFVFCRVGFITLSEFQRNSEILSTSVEMYDRPFSRVRKGLE
jgi:hypothetical protein